MCSELPCSCIVVILALAVGYFAGKGNEVHVSEIPRTLEQELAWCPAVLPPLVSFLGDHAVNGYQKLAVSVYGEAGDFAFRPDWAGAYVVSFYVSAIHLTMGMYKFRHADAVPIPTKMGDTPTFQIGHVAAPDTDIDDPHYLAVEKFVPRVVWNRMFLPGLNCYMGGMRRFEFQDTLAEGGNNTWEPLLKSGKYKRKRDWVMSFYERYSMLDGAAAYPAEENDFGAYFWKQDQWDDGLEKAMAFDLIGAHRIKPAERSFGGETLAFVLPLKRMAAVDVREGFGRYGVDMYFNTDGLPVLIETPEGREVQRGDKDWQYWKFVWRSTLVNSITLVDHLHLAHYRAANILARVTRKTLPPNHFFRRFMSVFTFGSIYVNNQAMHTLLGTNHVLHRSTPFREFAALSDLVPTAMPSLEVWHGAILNDTTFEALPARLKETPYLADGRLLAGALRRLIAGVLELHKEEDCNAEGGLHDPHLTKFRNALLAMDAEAGYAASVEGKLQCKDLRELVVAFLWTVTGWHRHVGTVGDYYKDPDLAGFSWKEGEPFVRPKQCMLMSVVAAFTSMPQPKLIEDYTHVFEGIEKEAQIVAVWQKFREELEEVSATVRQRNKQRQMQNPHADPALVECSVAV